MVPKYFSRDCSTDIFSCSERKNRKKTRLKQGSKSRKENQIVVVVANPSGSSSLRCRTAIALLLHRYCYAVTLLSLRCRTAITPLSFRCRDASIALLSRCCCTAIAPVSLHCRSADVAPAVATQSHCYRTAITPLLLRCCRYAVAPQLHRYCSVAATLLNRYRSGPERI